MVPWTWTLNVWEHKREDACPHGASALVRGQILKERVSASDGTVEQIEQGDGMSSLLDVWGTPPRMWCLG